MQLELKWLGGVRWVAGLHAGDFAFDAVERSDRLAQLLPLRLRCAAKRHAQSVFIIAAEVVAQCGGEFPEVAHLRVNIHALGGKKRRINGSFDDFADAVGFHQKRRFIAQWRGKQAERRNFGGRVHPNKFRADRHGSDQVIELRRGGHRDIQGTRKGNEHGVGRDVCGREHSGEQSVLILAIAILIFENVRSGVRLVAAEAEGEADVTDILCNVGVKRLNLFEFRGAALDQLLRLGAYFRGRIAVAFFKAGVPGCDFVPIFEGSELHVRRLGVRL